MQVDAGKQASQSEETIIVPAKLNGLELTTHVLQLLSDIAKREMVLNSVVTISGFVKVWKLYQDFEVIPVPILWDHNVLNHSAHALGKH
jgi:hypothetical protein